MQTTSYSCAITKQGYQPMPAFWHVSGFTTLISNLREDSVGCSGQTLETSRIFQNTPARKTRGFLLSASAEWCVQGTRPCPHLKHGLNEGVPGDGKTEAKTQLVKTRRSKAYGRATKEMSRMLYYTLWMNR